MLRLQTESAAYTQAEQGASWGRIAGALALATAVALFAGFLVLPIVALLLRVPVSALGEYATRPVVLDALKLSLFTSLCSLGLMLALGTPVAFVLARHRFAGKSLLETLIEMPVVLPPAVAGVALLLAFGRRGLLGPLLDTAGVELAFTTAAVVLAQTFVASPFYLRSAQAAFQSVPVELEQVAATEGAGRWARFWNVIRPLALPGITGGAIIAWARALAEFGATILFAGNFQGRTQTMPLAIYTQMESDLNAAIIMSAILVCSSFALLVTFRWLSRSQMESTGT